MEKVYNYASQVNLSKSITDYFESIELNQLESINTMRMGEDIVLSDGHVPLHTDGTERGKDTVMLIICAIGGFVFNHESGDTTIHSGDLIRFNGNKLHGLTPYGLRNRFCAIIWDIPIEYDDIDKIRDEMKVRVSQLEFEIT